MKGIFLYIASTATLLGIFGQASISQPIVLTPFGRYEGSVKDLPTRSPVARYSGIAFAKPPVGSRRFQRPEALVMNESANRVINARKLGKSCWSITKTGASPYYSEDCLYLNVYVPYASKKPGKFYPVMVYFHGGGFVAGTVFPEPWLFVDRGQVIVVTFNYRLGVFGFLTSGNNLLPANNGIWDQVLALEWVKNNIHYFGGDQNSITIFGNSAGAMSASLLALSPRSSHLFHKAIFQSGAASSLLTRNPENNAQEFGQQVGCLSRFDTDEFAACLRQLSVEKILKYSKSINLSVAQRQLDFMWMPTVDGDLIPDDPIRLLANRTHLARLDTRRKAYLFGLNNNEGSLLVDNFLHPISKDQLVENIDFFRNLVSYILSMKYDIPKIDNDTINRVISFYTGMQTPLPKNVLDFAADGIFYAPEIAMATALSNSYGRKRKGTYVYYFDYCPKGVSGSKEQKCMSHGLDVSYQFPRDNFKNASDQKMSEMFIDLISGFAKKDFGSRLKFKFPPFQKFKQSYLRLSLSPEVREHFHRDRMEFWMNDIPKLVKKDGIFWKAKISFLWAS